MSFYKWFRSENSNPYNSWGNGSAMRVSPVGFAYDKLEDVLEEAKKSAEVKPNIINFLLKFMLKFSRIIVL